MITLYHSIVLSLLYLSQIYISCIQSICKYCILICICFKSNYCDHLRQPQLRFRHGTFSLELTSFGCEGGFWVWCIFDIQRLFLSYLFSRSIESPAKGRKNSERNHQTVGKKAQPYGERGVSSEPMPPQRQKKNFCLEKHNLSILTTKYFFTFFFLEINLNLVEFYLIFIYLL